KAQNVLFNTIDALIGDPLIANAFGANVGSGATATLTDTKVDATGQVAVLSTTASNIDSTITNKTTASSSGLQGRTGTAVGAVLSLNKVSSKASSKIITSQGPGAGPLVKGLVGVQASATDAAAIDSKITLVSETSTNNINGSKDVKSTAVAG